MLVLTMAPGGPLGRPPLGACLPENFEFYGWFLVHSGTELPELPELEHLQVNIIVQIKLQRCSDYSESDHRNH